VFTARYGLNIAVQFRLIIIFKRLTVKGFPFAHILFMVHRKFIFLYNGDALYFL